MDYVIHKAALPSVPRSIRTPIESNDVNVSGTLNVLIAARDLGVQRVVYAPRRRPTANTEVLPKIEDMAALPLSPYAVNKLAGELLLPRLPPGLRARDRLRCATSTSSARARTRCRSTRRSIPKFIGAALRRPVAHDLRRRRAVARLHLRRERGRGEPARLQRPEGASGETINIACGTRVTLNELAGMIGRIVGTDVKPTYQPQRTGDVRHSLADIRKAERILGYRPKIGLEEGLRRTVDWLREQSA